MQNSDHSLSTTRIFDRKEVFNQNGDVDGGSCLKEMQNNKRRRPPLERGISRNNSESNLLPVLNIFLQTFANPTKLVRDDKQCWTSRL